MSSRRRKVISNQSYASSLPSTSTESSQCLSGSSWYISLLYPKITRESLILQIEKAGGSVIKSTKAAARSLAPLPRRFYVREWHLESTKKREEAQLDAEESFTAKHGFVSVDPDYVSACVAADRVVSRSLEATPPSFRELHRALSPYFAAIPDSSEIAQSYQSFSQSFDPEHSGPSPTRDKIYIVDLREKDSPVLPPAELEMLSRGLEAFFCASVHIASYADFQITVENGDIGVCVDSSLFYPVETDSLHRLYAPDILDCLSSHIPADCITYVDFNHDCLFFHFKTSQSKFFILLIMN